MVFDRSRRVVSACRLLAVLVLGGCGTPSHTDGGADAALDATSTESGLDVPVDAHSGTCRGDMECADGVFCNGQERCMPGALGADGHGCVSAVDSRACLAGQTCDEMNQRCVSSCAHAPDADGDGHRAADCGGDDCNDADPNSFPGNPEVCDAMNHDEDCDPRTFGFRDVDMDSYADRACCNAGAAGAMNCGDDCNDSRPNVHPALAEACDGLDNDCNGTTDEGVERTFYPDGDHDGFGSSAGATMTGCVPMAGFSEMSGDCDDARSDVHPGALEQCDLAMIDEDCDGMANPTTLCACSGDVTRACATRGGVCAAGTERCVGGSWGLCSIGPTPEACNGLDDNCDGTVDEALFVTCYPDRDNDGYAAAGAASVRSCPVPGRDGFAGCPPNQTNRSPLGIDIDCNDTDSTVSPGQPELCDSALRDENCDGQINPASLCMCLEGSTRPCSASGTCGAGNQTCSGGRWSSCSINPVAESCNGIDDNCNGTTDEGLTITCYADSDNDGYAASGTATVQSCPVTGRDAVGGCPTHQTNRAPATGTTDCNDTNAAVSPGAVEQCDSAMVDENCDGMANPSSLCACSGSAMRTCTLSGACAAGTQTCTDGSWGNCSIVPVAEVCNSADDDCDGATDEALTVTCYPDGDNDGFAATGAAARESCPISGREAVGGCPTNQTNRAPAAGTTDCNDASAPVNPAAVELCDTAMTDEDCDGVSNPASLCACSGTATRACTLPGACAAGTQTCASGTWGSCSIVPLVESCNGIDDNCNGTVDEGLTVGCYADGDNDGYAATGAASVQSCPVTGRAAVGGCPTNQTNRAPTVGNVDCADLNSSVNPGATELCDALMADENCDGTANPPALCTCSGSGTRPCTLPGACAAGTETCSGGAWAACTIGPSPETCNGIDDDCDGTVDDNGTAGSLMVSCYADGDSDGAGAGGPIARCPDPSRLADPYRGCPAGMTANGLDCNDGNATVRPGATETCNGIDDDCDGATDEALTASGCILDADGDGYGRVGATPVTLCSDAARMAHGYCPIGYTNSSTDCNDASASVHPGAAEQCNATDDNCDGSTDEGVRITYYQDVDRDGYGLTAATMAACSAPAGYVALNGDCNDASAAIHPTAFERCDAALVDDDCDSTANEGCACADGATLACGITTGACEQGSQLCVSGAWGGCVGSVGPVTEVCNGIDDDCDGATDETPAGGSMLLTCYLDRDGDTHGFGTAVTICPGTGGYGGCPSGYSSRATDCNDGNGSVSPSATEICNGIDDDCDAAVDEALTVSCFADGDNDTYGSGAVTTQCRDASIARNPYGNCPMGWAAASGDCNDATGAISPGDLEVCNGVDDNCNGTRDDAAGMVCVLGATRAGTGTFGSCGSVSGIYTCNADCRGETFIASPPAETCNGADDDCDGVADDPFTCVRNSVNPCVTGCGTVGTYTCTASCTAGTCAATEVCNGCDDDADGSTDEGLTVTCWADADDDTYAAAGAASQTFCPVSGRAAENGCPIYWTNRDPATGTDCADSDPLRYPTRPELCDGIDQDCDSTIDDGASSSCSFPNGVAACVTGSCLLVGCTAGFAGCDTDSSNGCEINTRTDASNCSLCGAVCPGGSTCTDGVCVGTITAVAAGGGTAAARNFNCILYSNGRVGCWGTNSFGQLGQLPMGGSSTTPLTVGGIADATQISAGGDHACALRATGGVVCWGSSAFGQLGAGTTGGGSATPVAVTGLVDAVEVVAGVDHTCARRTGGQVVCWGRGTSGQLGNGGVLSVATPVAVTGVIDATGLAAGANHSCAVRATGAVVCWGANASGQLGNGTTTASSSPVTVTGLADAVQVEATTSSTCARRSAGAVACWGSNLSGQLGDGTTTTSNTPVAVSGLVDAVQLAAGIQGFVCARRTGGGVQCWGSDNDGQLGNGLPLANSTTPVDVLNLPDATSVSSGASHACALRANGAVVCWGDNLSGQLGDGTTTDSPQSVSVRGIRDYVEPATGRLHSCARRPGGSVDCWGENSAGQLGDGTTIDRASPVAVTGLTDAVEVAGGWSHTCARRSGGGVSCWGSDGAGQLGNGAAGASLTPVAVTGIADAVQLAVGRDHSCVRRATGGIACWGQNNQGALGDGTGVSRTSPVAVSGITDAVDLAAGLDHTCARRATGATVCWGAGTNGALGNGGTASQIAPVTVSNLPDAIVIEAGGLHSCAIRSNGQTVCWGNNSSHELGDRTTTSRTTPVPVFGLSDAVAIEAGIGGTCALRALGTVVCWGGNSFGAAGNSTLGVDVITATAVSGLGIVTSLSRTGEHVCARDASGYVLCWGRNFDAVSPDGGQLGDNSTSHFDCIAAGTYQDCWWSPVVVAGQ